MDLAQLDRFPNFDRGQHNSPKDGACVMEAVSYIAGERWSDHPACVCPTIAAFCRAWNDALPNGERDTVLRPLVPLLIGTRGSYALAHRRSLMAADWLVRVHTPMWLRLAGLTAHADALASLPEITDMAQVPSLRGPIEAARRDAAAAAAAARAAAWDAAWAAARDAAGAAAWDAAWAAAGAAVWNAVRDAAWDAAWDAAEDAAWDAAEDAAEDAVGAKLKPTRDALIVSAARLVERMCALRDEAPAGPEVGT